MKTLTDTQLTILIVGGFMWIASVTFACVIGAVRRDSDGTFHSNQYGFFAFVAFIGTAIALWITQP